MSTWYRAWHEHIEPVEVIASTAKYVTYKEPIIVFTGGFDENLQAVGERQHTHREVRAAKEDRYQSFFPTWKEARQHLLEKAKAEHQAAQRKATECRDSLFRIIDMEEPKDPA